ncbi:MTOR-associated protein MEAK7-like [Macrosteles quadrilineatus]|uniref:MTOR-associated protein MEAK7-like n=1 Tax=Macrosteles quadrilineatus TaxID=74068 RepID=UPI0023E20B1B|nr:MTOR-associated protein MEAK7-like [Macrosteles quadrilineatus]
MGNKQSGTKTKRSEGSLHPQERKRLTIFLDERKGSAKFTFLEIKRLWSDFLTPSLLESYANFLLKSTDGRRDEIDLDDFISIYVKIIRGSSNEKAKCIATILGTQTNQEGVEIISYQSLCKYLSDLLKSYFFGLKSRKDDSYTSWNCDEPRENVIEEVIRGVCNDLQRTDDEVKEDLFEDWLHHSGLVNTLHCYVLGSMYNLEPEHQFNLIPYAQFPANISEHKVSLLLDPSQVVYLNSFLPSEHKEVWRFLFSTDSHGESFSKFVGCIVNQGPILVVVRTANNNTFGGFISTNVTLSPKWIGSEGSFLFKLGSSVDVFTGTGYNDHYAYLNCSQSTLPNGLGMGGQYGYWGLWIDSQFGVGECSETCTTYKNYKMLDSGKKFHIKNLEVWAVGEPPPTEEELGERSTSKTGRSALDQDPASATILEMAGREMHSKGIREGMAKKKH